MTSAILPGASESRFHHAMGQVAMAVDTEAELTQDPFRVNGLLDFCEFDLVFGGEFAAVLSSLAFVHDDKEMALVVLDPVPSYYQTNYGVFPAAVFPVKDFTPDLYTDFLLYNPNDDPTGAITDTANRLVITGGSGAWCVWADRGWEFCIVNSLSLDRPWREENIFWVSATEALEWYTEPAYKVPLTDADRDAYKRLVLQHGEPQSA